MPFIYKITNTINNKVYIGKSKYDSPTYFGSGLKITYALKKYGRDIFKKDTIEECRTDEVNQREVFWIDFYKSTLDEFGYNISKGGDGGDHYWSTLSTEARILHNKKISDSKLGKKQSPHSEETKKKMSASFNRDPEFLKKRGQAHSKIFTCINHQTTEKIVIKNLKDFCKDRHLSYSAMLANASRNTNRSTLCGDWSCSPGELVGPVEIDIKTIVTDLLRVRAEIHNKLLGKNNSGDHNPMWGRKHSAETKEKIRIKRLERTTFNG
jgi:group I intron endonuclease